MTTREQADAEPTRPGSGLSRRKMIAAAAGVLVGAAAGDALASTDEAGAANPSPMLLGQVNNALTTTTLAANTFGAPALEVTNALESSAALGAYNSGVLGSVGSYGLTFSPIQAGVAGGAPSFQPGLIGALGAIGIPYGAYGLTGAAGTAGVFGYNPSSDGGPGPTTFAPAGVVGLVGALTVTGALTTSTLPAGVLGFGTSPGTVGVEAVNNRNGLALSVQGSSAFSTAGTATIPIAAKTHLVSDPGVTSASKILVTLKENPGTGQAVWVVPHPGKGFTVNLTNLVTVAVPFSYFRIS